LIVSSVENRTDFNDLLGEKKSSQRKTTSERSQEKEKGPKRNGKDQEKERKKIWHLVSRGEFVKTQKLKG